MPLFFPAPPPISFVVFSRYTGGMRYLLLVFLLTVPVLAAPLHNTFVKLTQEKRLKVVVIGNSVSHGAPDGETPKKNYTYYLLQWLRAHFPEAKIEVKMSIIFAIGPEIQLFRMEDKLLCEKPDLVVTEFGAANGAWGEAGRAITERATEGYVRRLRLLLPNADCLMNLGIFATMMDDYTAGRTPQSVLFAQAVAQHYDCLLADSEKSIADRVRAGEPWATYMSDAIHPSPAGHALHGEVICAAVEAEYARFRESSVRTLAAHPFPRATVHPDPWLFPRLTPAFFADKVDGFAIAETGRVKYLAATRAGAHGTFTAPAGQVVGVLLRSPHPRGNLEVRLDGKGRWVRLSQKQEPRFTEEDDPANYLQRNFFAAYGLPLYARRVDFRVAADPEDKGQFAVQFVGFLVIEHAPGIDFARP
jgi:lysophospholipase L1-like esterase